VAGEGEQVGAVEAAEEGAEAEDGEQGLEFGVVVVEGHGPAEEQGDDPEGDAADGLEGECGVEEEGIIAAGGLDDGGCEADVG